MRYQRVKNVAWRRIGADTVIVNLGRRRMLAVNEAGGAVWEALARGAPVSRRGPGGPHCQPPLDRHRPPQGSGGATVAAPAPSLDQWPPGTRCGRSPDPVRTVTFQPNRPKRSPAVLFDVRGRIDRAGGRVYRLSG